MTPIPPATSGTDSEGRASAALWSVASHAELLRGRRPDVSTVIRVVPAQVTVPAAIVCAPPPQSPETFSSHKL
ncbi:MAG: hypothetical protein KDK97_23465 [Verrucomicrobiales bacterium]|nr:hypothetical protein [Verrucomicrobiales bacterium]MCP5558015.1 hypothetical protein [Verrucomicrobiaceae bacterium]